MAGQGRINVDATSYARRRTRPESDAIRNKSRSTNPNKRVKKKPQLIQETGNEKQSNATNNIADILARYETASLVQLQN